MQRYCSRTCQRKHWKQHRDECHAIDKRLIYQADQIATLTNTMETHFGLQAVIDDIKPYTCNEHPRMLPNKEDPRYIRFSPSALGLLACNEPPRRLRKEDPHYIRFSPVFDHW